MTQVLYRLTTIIALVFYALPSTYASDLEKEKRWADQISDSLFDGEIIWLKADEQDFLSIFTAPDDTQHKRVILMLHGTGAHPDWPQLINPLRIGLINHAWYSLSIQMPILANEADYADYAPLYNEIPSRMDAAIEFLLSQGLEHIVILGHSQGAAMAAHYLAQTEKPIKQFISIGIPSYTDIPAMNTHNKIRQITIPMLDIYGSHDLEEIINNAPTRRAIALKSGNHQYTLKMLSGDHFFENNEQALLDFIIQWLKRTQ